MARLPRALNPGRRPVPAAIAVVIRAHQVLLVRRANPPDAGRWGFPGGKIDFGESIEQAAQRELLEETGVRGEAQRVFTAVDVFDHALSGELRQHFLLVAVLCRYLGGEPVGGDDALDAQWFALDALEASELALSHDVARVAREGARLARMAGAITP
ncbi:MutT/nudix family protein [Bordetella ansorpii]|uniref:MutT/nudix family protein n=1 Tax=Bordetella ansorpii TaxID=288768 RepID=A0A157RNW3_9BORD|nr:NUDIX hydrolase [Bordetella ansorpii]SAI59628.1 MutT/nudix family protein [Bordetella ansorpii]